jgi:hypothetical protein
MKIGDLLEFFEKNGRRTRCASLCTLLIADRSVLLASQGAGSRGACHRTDSRSVAGVTPEPWISHGEPEMPLYYRPGEFHNSPFDP